MAEAIDGPTDLAPPVFVVGFPRSGTTLVRTLISDMGIAMIPFETHLVGYWLPRYRSRPLTERSHLDRFWEEFTTHERFARSQLEPDRVKANLMRYPACTFREVMAELLREQARVEGTDRAGEKTPNHFKHLETLTTWFPRCSIVYLLRDPRAVVASHQLVEADWAQRPVGSLIAGWRRSVHEANRWRPDERVLVVKYESLVTDGDAVDQVRAHVAAEPGARRQRSMPSSRSSAFDPRAAIDPGHIERWKTVLDPTTVAEIERGAGPEMHALGYETETSPSALGLRLRYGVASTSVRSRRWVRRVVGRNRS